MRQQCRPTLERAALLPSRDTERSTPPGAASALEARALPSAAALPLSVASTSEPSLPSSSSCDAASHSAPSPSTDSWRREKALKEVRRSRRAASRNECGSGRPRRCSGQRAGGLGRRASNGSSPTTRAGRRAGQCHAAARRAHSRGHGSSAHQPTIQMPSKAVTKARQNGIRQPQISMLSAAAAQASMPVGSAVRQGWGTWLQGQGGPWRTQPSRRVLTGGDGGLQDHDERQRQQHADQGGGLQHRGEGAAPVGARHLRHVAARGWVGRGAAGGWGAARQAGNSTGARQHVAQQRNGAGHAHAAPAGQGAREPALRTSGTQGGGSRDGDAKFASHRQPLRASARCGQRDVEHNSTKAKQSKAGGLPSPALPAHAGGAGTCSKRKMQSRMGAATPAV